MLVEAYSLRAKVDGQGCLSLAAFSFFFLEFFTLRLDQIMSDCVPSSSIRAHLLIENRLLREALVRLFRKRSDLVVVGHDGPADATAYQVLDTQFDVLLIDSFQTTWPAAKIARETG